MSRHSLKAVATPSAAERRIAWLVQNCREAAGQERMCHIWSEDLLRLCDAIDARPAPLTALAPRVVAAIEQAVAEVADRDVLNDPHEDVAGHRASILAALRGETT
jgi:hypothetical protein